MALVAQSGAQLAGVMLPKTEGADDLSAVHTHADVPLIALVPVSVRFSTSLPSR